MNVRYVLEKVISFFPAVVALVVINFMVVHLAPGDPAYVIAGDMATPEYVEQIRREFRLDRPLHEQLVTYVEQLLRGNLGYSFYFRQPVWELIIGRIPSTVVLMFSAFLISAFLGIFLGIVCARNTRSIKDNCVSIAMLAGYSMPTFLGAHMLIWIFGNVLRLLPVSGTVSTGQIGSAVTFEYVLDLLSHLILPASVLGLYYTAFVGRLTRTCVMEALSQDYILTARSKGLSENRIVYRHALRNAILPEITVLSMNLGTMLAGSVFVETVFGWPGIGRLMYEGVFVRDYPLLLGILLVVSISVIFANLFTDVIYGFLDPRVSS